MHIKRLNVEGPLLFESRLFQDERGYFTETFRQDAFREAAGDHVFVQDNRSHSKNPGTVRGLHFQKDPCAQGKLVTCLAGTIFDVAVDIRPGSRSFGQHVSTVMNGGDAVQFWIPPGFAHGFCTLTPDCLVAYKVTAYYSPDHDRGLAWDDPDLGIDWPFDVRQATLSEKDGRHPRLRDLAILEKEN